jgi:hypothetical protein
MIEQANKIINKGFYFIPLLKNAKNNKDSDFLTREYTKEDLIPEGNLGINPKKSNVYVVDLDSDLAIKFGNKWLPKDTLIGAREYPNGRIEKTHWYFKSDNTLEKNNKNLPAELYCDHNIVAFGTTIHKETNEPMKRYWANDEAIQPFNKNIKELFNLINVCAKLGPNFNSCNKGGLLLDSCLHRYCKWSDEKRIEFLTDFFDVVLPGNKHNTIPQWKRIVKSNNNYESNNAGYEFLASHLGMNKKEVRALFNTIGVVDEDKARKTIRNFLKQGIDMVALRTKIIAPLLFAIDEILPEGLVLFCGRAKSMKSWTMLLVCYLVQNGMIALGRKTTQGDCMYLGLEDSERRLKDREKKLGLNNLTPPTTVDVDAPYLGMGLEESIQEWIDEVSNPRLIVIDTLARVKQSMGKRSGTAYDHDNETLRNIQKLAVKNGVTIVLVSHLNKAPQDYAFDKITGSTGLQGMCDAMWLCERGENGAKSTLIGRGRDIKDFEFALDWNEETWRYDLIGDLGLVTLNDNRKEILKAIEEVITSKGGEQVRPTDVIQWLDHAPNSKEANNIKKTMQRMKLDYELLQGSKYGTYKLPKDVNKLNNY